MSKLFHAFWFSLIAIGIVGEADAIVRKGSGFTLSEWVWSKISTWPLRALVGGLLVWLIWHFLWVGPGRGVHKIDLAFVGAGCLIGLAAWQYGWR